MSNSKPQIPNLEEIVRQITMTLTKQFQENPSLLFSKAEEDILLTKSFKMHPKTLNNLLNIVHTKKLHGHTEYTQTRALYDAIELLGATMDIKERPEEVKKKEQDRSQAISVARNKAKLMTAA